MYSASWKVVEQSRRILESRTMEGGRIARSVSNKDKEEGTRLGASRHANYYSVNILELS